MDKASQMVGTVMPLKVKASRIRPMEITEDMKSYNVRAAIGQVWTLTQFFSVSFLWKLIDLLEGQINYPSHQGNTILFRSSQQLPRLRLGRCFRNYRDTRTPSGVAP